MLPGGLGRAVRGPKTSPTNRSCSRWGLPTSHVTMGVRELLPHAFTLTSEELALREADCFLWHFPWGRPRWPLTSTIALRSSDFPLVAPPRRRGQRPSGPLALRLGDSRHPGGRVAAPCAAVNNWIAATGTQRPAQARETLAYRSGYCGLRGSLRPTSSTSGASRRIGRATAVSAAPSGRLRRPSGPASTSVSRPAVALISFATAWPASRRPGVGNSVVSGGPLRSPRLPPADFVDLRDQLQPPCPALPLL